MRSRQSLLLASVRKQFAYQHTPVSITGMNVETTLYSVVIPGGTMGPNGVLYVIPLWSITSSTNNKSGNINFDGNNLSGFTLASTYVSAQAGMMLRNRNSQSSQVFFRVGFVDMYSTTGTANSFFTINTSVDKTLIVTGKCNTPTNTKSVTSITRAGSTATATVTAHGYANGNSVLMAGATQTEYNGTFVISNVTTNTFDYTVTGTPATPATGTITAALWDTVTLEAVTVEVASAR